MNHFTKPIRTFHVLVVLIIILTMITSTLGLFYKTNGKPFDFVNQYGDTVRIYGNGIYKNDSYFMAPIFKGTDFTVFFLAVPLLLIALIMNIKKNSLQTTLFLTAVIAFFMYYSASISLGVVYNVLHLVYIALFSCSFFAFITGFSLLREYDITASETMYTRSLKIFLILCGVSLFVAWLPDIIVSLQNNRSLALIEVYTTQITYVFDMAIISPVIFVCLYHVSKRNSLGYMLLGIILNTLVLVGILVINQTLFQAIAGIELPIGAIITKVGIFVLLALVAIYYEVRLFRKIKGSDYSIVKKFIDT